MLREQQMTVVVKIADERRRHAGVQHALFDRRHRGGGFRKVHRDAHELRARLHQLDALPRGRLHVGRVGVGHRLHGNRRPAPDLDVADLYPNGFMQLDCCHLRKT